LRERERDYVLEERDVGKAPFVVTVTFFALSFGRKRLRRKFCVSPFLCLSLSLSHTHTHVSFSLSLLIDVSLDVAFPPPLEFA